MNWGFAGARGASWVVAKSMASRTCSSESGLVLRMSSMSWRRRRAKWRAASFSRSWRDEGY